MAAQHPDLIPLGGSLPLRVYLRSLWQRRQFALNVPLSELRAQHMDTVLGNIWHLLNPILLVTVYMVVFGLLLRTGRGIENFVTYLAIGVFTYSYSQRSILACSRTIVANTGLIRSLAFPRAVLPISAVVRETLAFLPAIGIMIVLALATGEPVTPGWLLLPPVLALLALFSLGFGFITARLTDRFHDFQNVLPFVFRLLFYLSGILYSFTEVLRGTSYAYLTPLTAVNPFFAFISLVRVAIMTSYHPDPVIGPWLWPSVGVWTPVILIGGFLFFRAGEKSYGRG